MSKENKNKIINNTDFNCSVNVFFFWSDIYIYTHIHTHMYLHYMLIQIELLGCLYMALYILELQEAIT